METGGEKLGSLRFTVEVFESGAPIILLGRNLRGAREHVPLPQALRDLLEAYALQVVKG